MQHSRARIRLNNTTEANDFVMQLNSDGTSNKYVIEDFASEQRVNARSLIGVIYALTEFNDETYLVNETHDGYFPNFVDAYRV